MNCEIVFQTKVHVKWIICENYTPNGVVVVDVVVPKTATKELVVEVNGYLAKVDIMFFKCMTF
jgi:hypothetical protein